MGRKYNSQLYRKTLQQDAFTPPKPIHHKQHGRMMAGLTFIDVSLVKASPRQRCCIRYVSRGVLEYL